MAAKNANVSLDGNWQLASADSVVTGITVSNLGNEDIKIMGTVGAVAPTTEDGIILKPGDNIGAATTLADLFPGVAATRLYAKTDGRPGTLFISHA